MIETVGTSAKDQLVFCLRSLVEFIERRLTLCCDEDIRCV
jgi:hypothetical protein